MKTALIQLLTAFVSSLGFSMLFGLRRRFLPYAALGGLLCWGVYLGMSAWTGKEFHPSIRRPPQSVSGLLRCPMACRPFA